MKQTSLSRTLRALFASSPVLIALASGCSDESLGIDDLDVKAKNVDRRNIELVGALDFDQGPYANIWVHNNYAYVGQWNIHDCAAKGVRVADISNPKKPKWISTLAQHTKSSAEHIVVRHVENQHFRGDLLAVGLQHCYNQPHDQPPAYGPNGLELWDVTNPKNPVRLGFFASGTPTSEDGGGGVHEFTIIERDGRLLALTAIPYSEVETRDNGADLRIVDITDPKNPTQVSDWGIGKNAGLAFGSPDFFGGMGAPYDCTPPAGTPPLCKGPFENSHRAVFAHSVTVSADGQRAFVSYWDAGMVILDISNLSAPRFLGRANPATLGASIDGNLHSAVELSPGIVVTTEEDFSPEDANPVPAGDDWGGGARFWNVTNPGSPQLIGQFTTPNTKSQKQDGWYSAHDPYPVGSLLVMTNYTDGVRVLDVKDPTKPREIGYFTAPKVPDRFRCPKGSVGTQSVGQGDLRPMHKSAAHNPSNDPDLSCSQEGLTPPGNFWGAFVRYPYIYVSDINAGLYVLKITGLDGATAPPEGAVSPR